MGFKEFLKSAPEEGGEEITQYSLENAINQAVAGNTAKWASMTPGIEGVPYEVDMRVKLVQNKGDALKNNLYYFTPEEILSIKRIDSIPPTGEGRAQHLKKEGKMLSNDPSLP